MPRLAAQRKRRWDLARGSFLAPPHAPEAMRRPALLLALGLAALALVPVAAADVIVRTCDSATMCEEVARVPAPTTCYVDYMKGGHGKPGTLRSTCITH